MYSESVLDTIQFIHTGAQGTEKNTSQLDSRLKSYLGAVTPDGKRSFNVLMSMFLTYPQVRISIHEMPQIVLEPRVHIVNTPRLSVQLYPTLLSAHWL